MLDVYDKTEYLIHKKKIQFSFEYTLGRKIGFGMKNLALIW